MITPTSASAATSRNAHCMPAANASRISSSIRSAAPREKRARISVDDSVPASAPCSASTSLLSSRPPARFFCRLSSLAVTNTVVVRPSPTDPPAIWNM